jgi:hypothetical protein
MSLPVSILVSVTLSAVVLLVTAREVSEFRAYQRDRSELYPYSRRRLWLRMSVSGCILAEIWLLLLARHTLSPGRPTWFAVYVGLVLALAGIMSILAIVDWRESRTLWNQSEKRLLSELIEELKQGVKPPDLH